MDDFATTDADPFEAAAFSLGHVAVPGHEIDCRTCRMSGPYVAADGSVVYIAAVARHHHQRMSDACPQEFQTCDECWVE